MLSEILPDPSLKHKCTGQQIVRMKTLQQLKQSSAGAQKATCFTTVRPRCVTVSAAHQQQASSPAAADVSRRNLLAGISAAGLVSSSFVQPLPAAANPLEDIARQITRPSDITPLDAAVALLDARATLRDMSSLVSSRTQLIQRRAEIMFPVSWPAPWGTDALLGERHLILCQAGQL